MYILCMRTMYDTLTLQNSETRHYDCMPDIQYKHTSDHYITHELLYSCVYVHAKLPSVVLFCTDDEAYCVSN